MVENALIAALFLGALYYIFGLFKKQFKTKDSGCAAGCSHCKVTDIKIPHEPT
jgi:hypothetical protein